MLNIIMYHYIRDNEDYSYNCFSRRKNEFESQVELFKNNSIIVNPLDISQIEYYLKNDKENGYLLSFDDGYADHAYCAEFLKSHDLNAIFFPPINVLNGELLDVNAIHFLIGQEEINHKNILEYLIFKIKELNLKIIQNDKPSNIEDYLNQSLNDRYNSEIETLLIKKLLQRDIIGSKNRKKLIEDAIFSFTKKTYFELVRDLYLSSNQMKKMLKEGMLFGSHCITHRWLNSLSYKEQYREINESFSILIEREFLDQKHPKILCYPYGAYDKNTLNINEDLKIDYALTTDVGSAFIQNENDRYLLKRWNTNDCWNKIWNKPQLPN